MVMGFAGDNGISERDSQLNLTRQKSDSTKRCCRFAKFWDASMSTVPANPAPRRGKIKAPASRSWQRPSIQTHLCDSQWRSNLPHQSDMPTPTTHKATGYRLRFHLDSDA